jgi:hypothetical protein
MNEKPVEPWRARVQLRDAKRGGLRIWRGIVRGDPRAGAGGAPGAADSPIAEEVEVRRDEKGDIVGMSKQFQY